MKNLTEKYCAAVEQAISDNHARGFPVYQCKKGYIVAIYPDGREVILEKASIDLSLPK